MIFESLNTEAKHLVHLISGDTRVAGKRQSSLYHFTFNIATRTFLCLVCGLNVVIIILRFQQETKMSKKMLILIEYYKNNLSLSAKKINFSCNTIILTELFVSKR